ncbi:MAG: hypothetical protein IKT30_06850 [Bacteroidaceae bacterium]|nr:hypothetical protein [Bacteroidaceae bacterium]
MEQPAKKPSAFYLMEKTAGGQSDKINQATIAIQSYADTLYDAALMNETIKAAMTDAIELDEVSRVEINSDYNFTDPTTKQYRYQAVFVVTYY